MIYGPEIGRLSENVPPSTGRNVLLPVAPDCGFLRFCGGGGVLGFLKFGISWPSKGSGSFLDRHYM